MSRAPSLKWNLYNRGVQKWFYESFEFLCFLRTLSGGWKRNYRTENFTNCLQTTRYLSNLVDLRKNLNRHHSEDFVAYQDNKSFVKKSKFNFSLQRIEEKSFKNLKKISHDTNPTELTSNKTALQPNKFTPLLYRLSTNNIITDNAN